MIIGVSRAICQQQHFDQHTLTTLLIPLLIPLQVTEVCFPSFQEMTAMTKGLTTVDTDDGNLNWRVPDELVIQEEDEMDDSLEENHKKLGLQPKM